MLKSPSQWRWATVAVSLAAVAVSAYLVGVHAATAAGDSAGGLCGFGGPFSCSGAAASRWATFMGAPIALLGAGFYAGLAGIAAFASRARERTASALVVLSFAAACVYSVFLLAVSVFDIGGLCPVCALLYLLGGAGLFTATRWQGGGVGDALRALIDAPEAFAEVAVWAVAPVVVCGLYWHLAGPAGPPVPTAVGGGPPAVVDARALAILDAAHAPAKGPDDARVVIVEFSDFQCPFCSTLAASLGALAEARPDDVRIEFRHLPLSFHRHANRAARAAVCAQAQGDFWALHDAMFADQGSLHPIGLREMAADAGLDVDALDACVDAPDTARVVADDERAAQQLGIEGTPTFFVNGRRFQGTKDVDEFVALVDQLIAEQAADATTEPTAEETDP